MLRQLHHVRLEADVAQDPTSSRDQWWILTEMDQQTHCGISSASFVSQQLKIQQFAEPEELL